MKSYQAQLEGGWRRFQLFQNELYTLDEDDIAQELEAFKTYFSLATRIRELMEGKRSSTPSTPKCSSNPSNYFQDSNNNLYKNSNDIQTPLTENVAPNRTSIPPHEMRRFAKKFCRAVSRHFLVRKLQRQISWKFRGPRRSKL